MGEVGSDTGTVFENSGFSGPEVHDSALVDQIIFDAKDETGVGLGSLVGVFGDRELGGLWIDVVVALGGAGDAVGEVESGIEPLRGVWCGDLLGQHVDQFVVERLGIFFGVEVAVLFAPMPPASCESVEHLSRIGLTGFGGCDEFLVRRTIVDAVYFSGGDTGFAEILLRKDVGGNLAPLTGNHDIFHEEYG